LTFLEQTKISFPSQYEDSSPTDEEKSKVLLHIPRIWKFVPVNESYCLEPPNGKYEFDLNTKSGFPLIPIYRFEEDEKLDFYRKGFLFNKPMKVGGSTASGVLLRMAKNLAKRYRKDYRLCDGIYAHTPGWKFKNRIPGQSFLMSLLRHPTKRHLSHFYHMFVSREGMKPTLEHFRAQEELFHNYYIRKHATRKMDYFNISDMTLLVNEILNGHDFLAITERLDESLVVLHMLLGVPLGDMLYLNAKSSGGYDGGGSSRGCTYIVPSKDVPQDIQDYIQSDEWKDMVKWDNLLYQVVNQSLDATIEWLGRSKFEKQLQRFQHAQKTTSERCRDTAIYPCSDTGEYRKSRETNCLFLDAGCGYPCIDEVANELGLYY
jgi:Galactose-3-O-sulfotransferase